MLWNMCQGTAQVFDSIPWSESRKLSWQDFKAPPHSDPRTAAITASGITYSFSSRAMGNAVTANFEVYALFYPNQSWYRPQQCNAHILAHEQLHFDITELFARKMRQRLQETTFSLDIREEVAAIYSDILRELDQFQQLYDVETNYSRDVEKQEYWNQKVAQALSQH